MNRWYLGLNVFVRVKSDIDCALYDIKSVVLFIYTNHA